jgi:hypothetical protein
MVGMRVISAPPRQSSQKPSPARAPSVVPPIVHDVLGCTGQALDGSVRSVFEQRFGHDFTRVRVHSDARAAESARTVDALAYTVGSHVVFGAEQYRPHTGEGAHLLAHELAHVIQQRHAAPSAPLRIASPGSAPEREADLLGSGRSHVPVAAVSERGLYRQQRRPTRSRAERLSEQAEAAARDIADARDYVNSFYDTLSDFHSGLSRAAHRSIHQFSGTSGIPDSRLGANVVYQLIRIVLGILPGADAVVRGFDLITRGGNLAVNGARLATVAGVAAQRGAAGVFTASQAPTEGTAMAASNALDSLSRYDTEGIARIQRERRWARALVDRVGQNPAYRNSVLVEVRRSLGPELAFDAPTLQQFEREYELQLYKFYYSREGWIDHTPPANLAVPYTRYTIRRIPEAVQNRIRILYAMGGRTPRVSIDGRFAGDNTDYVDRVRHLIDLGIPLYRPFRHLSQGPETLHTGDDLQQPYRGPRYREVR